MELDSLRAERDMWRERAQKRAAQVDVEKGQDQTLNLRLSVSQWLLAESYKPNVVLREVCADAYRKMCVVANVLP